jgi:hypothetical protein
MLEDIPVKQVFPEEEHRPNWRFVLRDEPVITVRELFSAFAQLSHAVGRAKVFVAEHHDEENAPRSFLAIEHL